MLCPRLGVENCLVWLGVAKVVVEGSMVLVTTGWRAPVLAVRTRVIASLSTLGGRSSWKLEGKCRGGM